MKQRLSRPVRFANQELAELDLRDPVWGDFADVSWTIGASGLSIRTGDLQTVVARLSGLPLDVIQGLAPADGAALWGLLTPFLLGAVRTPADASPASSSSSAG